MKNITEQFEQKQDKILVAASGRVRLALNETSETVKEQVLIGIDSDGVEKYQEEVKTLYSYDIYWLNGVDTKSSSIENSIKTVLKEMITQEIDSYDSSSAVNSFILNGNSVWLDKATRVGLMNSTTIAKNLGQQNTTLWLGSTKIEVGCDKAIQLLGALEMYALQCFNVTAAHKKTVAGLDDISSILSYNYRTGYPDKLNMEV